MELVDRVRTCEDLLMGQNVMFRVCVCVCDHKPSTQQEVNIKPALRSVRRRQNRTESLWRFCSSPAGVSVHTVLPLSSSSLRLFVDLKLQNVDLLRGHAERRLPVDPDGAHPPVAAPPLGSVCRPGELRGAEHPPQAQLRPEGLAEDEVDERVEADVEHRPHDGQLLQVEEGLAPGARLQEGVGQSDQVVRDEADAEDADQHHHVPARLGELLGAQGHGLLLLSQRQPAGGAVVEEDEGDEDEQEDGGGEGVDDLVEEAELFTVQDITAHHAADGELVRLGAERQADVGARHGQQDDPGYYGDDVGGSRRLQDVIS